MNILDIILVGLSLSMDAFALSLTMGINTNKNNLIIPVSFSMFQVIMPILGYFLSLSLYKYIKVIDHWIVFILLTIISIKMFLDAFKDENKVSNINIKSIIIMSICVSIDAFAMGIALSLTNTSIICSLTIIGLITFILSFIGLKVGNITSKYLGVKSQILGGFILLIIAFKILFEHLNIV